MLSLVVAANGYAATSGMRLASSAARMMSPNMATFYDFSANTLDGKSTAMSDYKGKPVLILNVASL